jgi:hypothetical protein
MIKENNISFFSICLSSYTQILKRIGSLESPTIICEDNATCVVQMETGYVKTNLNKHMVTKLFFPHDLHKNGDINILQI